MSLEGIYRGVCKICGGGFSTKYKTKIYCSIDCQDDARRNRSRVSVKKLWDKRKAVRDGQEQAPAQKYVKKTKKPGVPYGTCVVCGAPDTQTMPHQDSEGVYFVCPDHAGSPRRVVLDVGGR